MPSLIHAFDKNRHDQCFLVVHEVKGISHLGMGKYSLLR